MTKDVAKTLSELMISMGAQLNESVRVVQQVESDEDFKRYRGTVSKLMFTMLVEVMNPIYAEHPDLKPPQLL